MGISSLSPKLLKGAFIAYYGKGRQPRTIVFQLNPETIQRRVLPPRLNNSSSSRGDVRERISFVLPVDVKLGDDFFVHDSDGESRGVLPFLSAVELLAYPARVVNEVTNAPGASGFAEIINFLARLFRSSSRSALPHVGLVLGERRMIPVRVKSVHIDEEAFDPKLQPTRASVKIVMDALTERESRRHPQMKEMYEHYLRLKVSLAIG